MISVKKFSISNHCCMCGLCEIEKYKNYILKTKDGKLKPLNDGILLNKKQIDLIQNLAQNCIVDAISFSDVIKSKTISEAYAEINDIINVKLRDHLELHKGRNMSMLIKNIQILLYHVIIQLLALTLIMIEQKKKD